jgi:2-polyprenyl-3-methyl-5-hydroxy-6-metoxy-1,4-benzoquinol methylase
MDSFEKATKRDEYFRALRSELEELLDPETGKLSLKYSRYTDCPLCNSAEKDEVFVKNGYTFVRCYQCGLVFVNPQVQPELLKQFYKSSKANDLWMDILLSGPEQAWRFEYFSEALEYLKKYFPGLSRILDVGSGVGHFLDIARQEGLLPEGIELNEKAREFCLKKGLIVHGAPLEDFDPSMPYDVVSLFGMLEHVNDPIGILNRAKQIVKKGGGVIAIVPNVYSFVNLFLREKGVTFDGRNHLLYFSKETLEYLFKKCGFEVIHKDTVLFGIENVKRYISFEDPYSSSLGDFPIGFNSKVKTIFTEERKDLEKWILENDLGYRIRMIGRNL